MLANPLVMPAYASPEIWLVALVAMLAEIRTEVALLRRHVGAVDLSQSLLLINIMTWLVFLIAVDRLDASAPLLGWSIAGLELAVVIAETFLIWGHLRIGARARQASCVGFPRVAFAVLVGNIVSFAVSMVPVAIIWLLR